MTAPDPWYPEDAPPSTVRGALLIVATALVGVVLVWALLALTVVVYEGTR